MLHKLTEIEIVSFRGIQNLTMKNLGQVNIVTGDNNSGKTTFLEAINILAESESFYNIFKVLLMRESRKSARSYLNRQSYFKIFEDAFDKKQKEKLQLKISGRNESKNFNLDISGNLSKEFCSIEEINKYYERNSRFMGFSNKINTVYEDETLTFVGTHSYIAHRKKAENDSTQLELFNDDENSDGKSTINLNKYTIERQLKLKRKKESTIDNYFISSIDHIINDDIEEIVKDTDLKNDVIQLLKIFDNNIEDLLIIKEDNSYINCLKSLSNGIMPISLYGDGIKKVLTLAKGIVFSKGGLLLIDEVETSIHKRIMPDIFKWLIEAARMNNVQIFMTTHSLEVVDEIIKGIDKEANNALRIVTLHNNKNGTIARVLTGIEAKKLRENFNMELRK